MNNTNFNPNVLKHEERAVFELRSLYQRYGYLPYKMSKFEEYDLYVRNKDFLISDNIITFTDTSGKLMALKPDVTLSIIKNTDDTDSVQKVCYNENVYRISKGSQSFKEIMQVGLECIGNIDSYLIFEVLMLAAGSLERISSDYVLDISHLGIVSTVIDSVCADENRKKEILEKIGQKSIHEIDAICEGCGCSPELIKKLVSLRGTPESVIEKLRKFDIPELKAHIDEFENVLSLLEKCSFSRHINIDFSVINDMSYYNGFVFKGFVNGIASGVLSGGQYDKLMKKMGKKSCAIGFAVYLDLLERLEYDDNEFDVDSVLLYDEKSNLSALADAVKLFSADGKSVMVQKCVPENIKYKQLLKLNEKGVEILENNA